MGGFQLVDGLMDVAFGEQDGTEGAVRGGNLRFKLNELCELLVRSGEVVAGIGGGAETEGCVRSAEVAFDRGGVCLSSRLRVSR